MEKSSPGIFGLSMKKVLAITPARGGSKGVPRKNIKSLCGKPLLGHTIDAALACSEISHYLVNTEDEEIANYARSRDIEVQGRPEDFWYDNTFQEVDRLLVWAVKDFEERNGKVDVVVLLYPTSPLRTTESISQCIRLVTEEGYDSALTLKEDRSYLWKRIEHTGTEVEPTNYNPEKRGPNQLEGWNQWVENKAVYVMKRDLLIDSNCRLGGKIGHIVMSKLDSVDIDTPDDFSLVENIIKSRG
jgi:CMP-N,N'-diacetyllegionaminic acid synthase